MLTISISALAAACIASAPAQAESIAITYSVSGSPTAPPVITGTTLTLSGLATGSILSDIPTLNLAWNPVTFHTQDIIDLTTGLNHGSFSITFADGNTLSGTLFEDDSQVLPTNAGPFTQTLTFTAGTGEFVGATGSISGSGTAGAAGFTSSGAGTLNAPAVPEPASAALLFIGLGGVLIKSQRRRSGSRGTTASAGGRFSLTL